MIKFNFLEGWGPKREVENHQVGEASRDQQHGGPHKRFRRRESSMAGFCFVFVCGEGNEIKVDK